MENFLRPAKVEINLSALEHNYHLLKQLCAPSTLIPVLKANAYGHGLLRCALHMQDLGASYLSVAFLDEAIALRKQGITTPILCFSAFSTSQIEGYLYYDVTFTIPSLEKLKLVEDKAKTMGRRAKIHIKIDTGMERIGTHYFSCETLIREALESSHCHLEAVYSHFAESEQEDSSFTKLQLERFLTATEKSKEHHQRHIANSGALLQFKESHLDYARAGLALYGISPLAKSLSIPLRSAMRLSSGVVYFKVIQPDTTVGYSRTWKAQKQTRVVTVPIGYGDGYPRELSNKGEVLIRGKRFPIIGRVCMDQFMVDIGDSEAFNGDEVVLLGGQLEENISVEEISTHTGTDPRHVLCSLNERLPRVYSH